MGGILAFFTTLLRFEKPSIPSAVVRTTVPTAAIAEVDFSPVLGRTLIACCWTGTSSTGVTGVEVGPPDSPTGAAGGVSNETRFDL